MITFVALVVLVLATARLTRVISKDNIFAPVSDWVTRKFGAHSFLANLINCHWCVGVWVSGATNAYALFIAALFGVITPWVAIALWPILAPAVAYAASLILDKEKADGV